MVQLSLNIALPFLVGVLALPADPSGDKNIGNGQGLQFITGACLSDADCGSGCCATLRGSGVCSARAAANEQGKEGCGFTSDGQLAVTPTGSATSISVSVTTAVATETPAGTGSVDADAAGAENVGLGNGLQFITGQCFSDADCASTCCAGRAGTANGACAARAVANANGKDGCGFIQS
ncbi:hypothetical protein B0J13DRAFT_525506 [Dactylonectria estremocensis]|uniref:Biotrophy-associated secreted protein 2 n=1 Tax=Dactylonectria estremocensis TaxID=1079267 RepID=A0A9P9ETF1_9HYPO|nr:hypothetical protein B0J13DRAFT_525506 [Dactylonectria estremocensis]